MIAKRLSILCCLLVLSCVAYMTIEARGNWDFSLPFRGTKLAALLVVATAVSSSTVLFQTVTRNRILTPSIMGFDALFVLLLTGAVFLFGAQNLIRLPAYIPFFVSLLALVAASLARFAVLLSNGRQDLMRLVLTGIIFATLFRSLTSFLQRIIDPNEFMIIQVASYARFTQIDTNHLMISSALIALTHFVIWKMRHAFDVLGLGHQPAINLGLSPKYVQFVALSCVAVLVYISTALVGPIAFLGLLVVSIAALITPSAHHSVFLPSSALVCAIVLVTGQTAMERVFKLQTPLTTVVDMLGGCLFLLLLLKGARK